MCRRGVNEACICVEEGLMGAAEGGRCRLSLVAEHYST